MHNKSKYNAGLAFISHFSFFVVSHTSEREDHPTPPPRIHFTATINVTDLVWKVITAMSVVWKTGNAFFHSTVKEKSVMGAKRVKQFAQAVCSAFVLGTIKKRNS